MSEFLYDSQNRLIEMSVGSNHFIVEYGLDNRISKFINALYYSDTFEITYPTPYTVVATKTFQGVGRTMDSLFFDANYSLVRSTIWSQSIGGPQILKSNSEMIYNPALRNPYYTSALQDFYLLQEISGYPHEFTEVSGPHLLIKRKTWEGGPPVVINEMTSRIVNQDNNVVHIQYRRSAGPGDVLDYERNYVYGCE